MATHTNTITRRRFLRGAGAAAALAPVAAAQAALPPWMPKLTFVPARQTSLRGDVLVNIFLRGGADMLNVIVPHGEDAYYRARPQLAIPRPDASGSDPKTIDLDGFFGVHPALAALLPVFQAGAISAIHATGSPHETRSHFEAMDYMERGTPGDYGMSSGWIGRHLAAVQAENASPVRAIGWGTAVQQSLRGVMSPVALQSIVDYHLGGDAAAAARMLESLSSLYALEGESLFASAEATRSAIAILAGVGYQNYRPQNGAEYPENEFAMALRQTAALIRAQVGLESACIDLGGWDTHVNQGTVQGTQARLLTQLAEGLAAFHADLGDEMRGVTVVVMSEFGRRVAENGGRGTDHGHGGAMLVMNGSLAGTPVIANWVGLETDILDRGEDLPVTTDYRDVLAEILTLRLNTPNLSTVLPDFTPTRVGVFPL